MMKFFSVIADCQIYSSLVLELSYNQLKKACVGHLEEEYEMMSSVKRNKVPV